MPVYFCRPQLFGGVVKDCQLIFEVLVLFLFSGPAACIKGMLFVPIYHGKWYMPLMSNLSAIYYDKI